MIYARTASRRHRKASPQSLGVGVLIVALCILSVSASASAPVAMANELCENEAQRFEQDVPPLPDCRAYEMVTSPDKDSGEPKAVSVGFAEPGPAGIPGAHAAANGNRMAFVSEYALPGSTSPGIDYLATRTSSGWTTENVIPKQTVESGLLCPYLVGMAAYSADLSKGVLADGFGQERPGEAFLGEGLECGHDEPRLVAGELEGFQNLFLRNNVTGSYDLIDVTPADVAAPKPPTFAEDEEHGGQVPKYFPASLLASSSDLSHVIFEEELPLTADAGSGDELYEWSGNGVRLVTILPDGAAVHGELAGAPEGSVDFGSFRHAVSENGLSVFFEAQGNLYVRKNGEQQPSPMDSKGSCTDPEKACTVQVDVSQGWGPGGGGRFVAASSDGSRVYFTDDATAGLTSDTVAGSGLNLYQYDTEAKSLTDLTPVNDAGFEGVAGIALGDEYEGREAGSSASLYFVAKSVLTSSPNRTGEQATTGAPNLYAYSAGKTRFVATLDQADSCVWSPQCSTARASADGRFIVFSSVKRLTGYDNTDSATQAPDSEIFLYDSLTGGLSCASCDPRGYRPAAPAKLRYPASPSTNEEMRNRYPEHNVSDAGQVFFETSNALSPMDVNGQRDVYEYDGGQVRLISSGVSDADSYLLDASTSGNDVFFTTAEQLLSRDKDAAYDIYDARAGGGFVESLKTAAPICQGEGCLGAAAPAPTFSAPASETFANVAIPGKKRGRPLHHRARKHKARRRRAHHGRGKNHRRAIRRDMRRNGGAK